MKRTTQQHYRILAGLIVIGLLVGMAATGMAQENYLFQPQSAEEIEDFFLQFKPPAESRSRRLQPKGIGNREPKGIERKLADDDVTLAELPTMGTIIQFDFDSARIKPESYPELQKLATALQGKLHEAIFLVVGHTDSTGPEDYNLKLSEKRARAVKEFLAQRHGIDTQRLIVKFYGESQPLVANDTKAHRAMNRRVEFACIW